MTNIHEIWDLSAPELDVYARLTETQLRNKREPEKGIFIAESIKVIRSALQAGCQPISLLTERRHLEVAEQALQTIWGSIPVYTADRELLTQLTGYSLTRGVLCAMHRPKVRDFRQVCAGARRVAVLEGITDAANVGAIFRSAAALGMDAVLLSPTCCDPLCRKSVRVSMGTVFQIPWARMDMSAEDWPKKGMQILKDMGFRTAVMALDERAITIEDPRPASEEKLAILLGTEGDGLSPATIAQADYTVCIPMRMGVDSLNVAAASAVAFWQLRTK